MADKVKTIHENVAEKYPISDFKYQKDLTKSLDNGRKVFDQNTINEIVLWKVNRFAHLDPGALDSLNKVSLETDGIDEDLTREIMLALLKTKGIRLAMASTILRFKNPEIYQILDQRVYRYIYGKAVAYPKSLCDQVEFYIDYLKKLRSECSKHEVPFAYSDRVLYMADKKENKGIPIAY